MDSIAEILEIARQEGETLCFEPHERTAFENLDQIGRLLERFPDLPIVYDPTHLINLGSSLEDSRVLLPNAATCHLRDAKPGQIQVPLGEGAIDFDWVLDQLQDAGFDGTISIEYLGFDESISYAVDSARDLKAFLDTQLGMR